MFHYIDHLFPDEGTHRKLVLHFDIDDIVHAQRSVDARMEVSRVWVRSGVRMQEWKCPGSLRDKTVE